MKPFVALIALMWVCVAAPSSAQTNPVVVELFTSQGCSSCPPADKLMHDLAARDDVIALALHVDYWDYIGWKDQFASPAHTERQKAYAVAGQRRSVYTPQMIINGTDSVIGARAMELAKLISDHAALPAQAHLAVQRAGDELIIRARMVAEAPHNMMVVQVLRYTPERSINITRGENAGHYMRYANVVHEMTIVADWDGKNPLELSMPVTGTDPVAVLVQNENHGAIVAAVRID
ncbi:DUF1223 domain-containing protein [Aestuariivita sp.]|jgi:hypothetical protein|uniref:DUF1223 domain-containing protein n=1 Tax=Aestuariivita sp. TaxID=1872407 RepID=UPI002170A774|nr:DUF1223 domain-containing protein [Aestuariivita sp.]MCE8009569.1 DUF1223 domain-containing protein [Aestuariivita sp.]